MRSPIWAGVCDGETLEQGPINSLADAIVLFVVGVDDTQTLHGGGDVGEPRRAADVLHLLELLDSSMENAAGRLRGSKQVTKSGLGELSLNTGNPTMPSM